MDGDAAKRSTELTELSRKLEILERENVRLRAGLFEPSGGVVRAPPEVQPLFDRAAAVLREQFRRIEIDPARALIGIDDERYLLIRASAFSIDFLDTLVQLYADRGQREALAISRGFLFDIAHTIGLHDARTFQEKLGTRDPIETLSAGPVHFAYTGWSLVDIKPMSQPTPDDNYCLVYEHSYSFEAASFLRAGRSSEGPVCIMSAGYSSGWCEASFGVELTAVEVECKARGDAACLFVMAPPRRIAERVREHLHVDLDAFGAKGFDVPTYFERKRVEEDLRESLRKLKEAQDELVRKERLATVGLLVAGVAHEVNTPLGVAVTAMSVVGTEIEALQAKFDAGELTRGDLRHFLDRASQASVMVRNNLDRAASEITNFKRVAVDHVTQEQRRVDLAVYVQQTLDNLKPVIRKGQLAIDLATEGTLDVVTHPGAVAQIITNFVTNSAAHGNEPGATKALNAKIELRRDVNGTVTLSYADDGRGMTADVERQAFQPFFTTARGGGGTGLGLHIVQSLVADVLRGKIAVTTAPGKGVQFVIEFPTA